MLQTGFTGEAIDCTAPSRTRDSRSLKRTMTVILRIANGLLGGAQRSLDHSILVRLRGLVGETVGERGAHTQNMILVPEQVPGG